MKRRLSCGFCWTRAFSSLALVAVFLAAGALHFVDPTGLAHYDLPPVASYGVGALEVGSALAFLAGIDVARFVFLAVALTGAGLHLRFQETNLLVLPAIPLVLLGALAWVNRPQAACACGLHAHGPKGSL